MIIDGRANIGAWPNLESNLDMAMAPNVGVSGAADTGAKR
jgi:hypothetical protein